MTIYYDHEGIVVHHGDCLAVLAELPDESVDSVCCDPPYGLANTDPAHVAETITRWVNGERDYLPGGAGFMGAKWDAFVPPVAVWDECLRVLKPGGHVLAFAGSRTVDLMTLGLRLAGFDIRDSVAWLYGSGFPKSLDVSKAIDRVAPRAHLFDAFSAHFDERWRASGMSRRDFVPHFPHYKNAESIMAQLSNWKLAKNVPSVKDFAILRDLIGLSDDWQDLIDRVEAEREVTGTRNGNRLAVAPGQGMDRSALALDITAPATPDAERWQGWGTALKPAFEPIVVARKLLAGTVAANVLAHGTGALNIDGCRVGSDSTRREKRGGANDFPREVDAWTPTAVTVGSDSGRWPSNVALDESQAAVLDEQSGTLTSGANPTRRGSDKFRDAYGDFAGQEECVAHRGADSGGASRFMYVAKADASERVRVNGVAHPTVKPLALMRWLVRLVTPPGGTVLEPFAGSGTTVEAAILEGFHCVAIEREADYLPLIRQRIHRRRDPVEAVKGSGEELGLFDLLEGEGA